MHNRYALLYSMLSVFCIAYTCSFYAGNCFGCTKDDALASPELPNRVKVLEQIGHLAQQRGVLLAALPSDIRCVQQPQLGILLLLSDRPTEKQARRKTREQALREEALKNHLAEQQKIRNAMSDDQQKAYSSHRVAMHRNILNHARTASRKKWQYQVI